MTMGRFTVARFCKVKLWDSLKGVSHKIEMGQIWYQKKDLEKLELHGYILALTEVGA